MAKYRYNGIIVPALLEWDRKSYPYVYIHRDNGKAYATSAPLSVVVVTGFFTSATATLDAPFLCSTFKTDANNREYWTEWETVTEITETKMYGSYGSGWSNHDILDADGKVFFSASDPVPVNPPIVVFDGEAVTEQFYTGGEPLGFPADTLTVADRLAIGDKVRITLDGVSAEYEVKKVPTSTQSLIGNAGLNGNGSKAEDDGGDWLIAAVPFEGMGYRRIYFYTRTEGTHQLKIELLNDEPKSVLAWQKHDAYKPNTKWDGNTFYRVMGGKWVEQDEVVTVEEEEPLLYKLGSLACSTIKKPNRYSHADTWAIKTWNGLTEIFGRYIWSDGNNIYHSYGSYDGAKDYVLHGDTWDEITWNIDVSGDNVWTDGTNIYYSDGTIQYVLNGNTWVAKSWNGLTNFLGSNVWTDGTHIYYSSSTLTEKKQYVLNGDTWDVMNWNVNDFASPWSDGTNIYAYKTGWGVSGHYVWNGMEWEEKIWNFALNYTNCIWTDGTNIYYSEEDAQYVLDGDNWVEKTWNGNNITASGTHWTDGTHNYWSAPHVQGTPNYILV